MAFTLTNLVNYLFKKSQGKGSTNDSRQFFEEPRDGRASILSDQVWNQSADIPSTAPVLADQAVSGVVKYWDKLTLTAIPGVTNSFYSNDLMDAIPFNFGDGSYNYALFDSSNNPIPFGLGDWLVDREAGLVTYYGTTPSGQPPKISFYQYIGTKGVGSGDGTGEANYVSFENSEFEKNSVGDWRIRNRNFDATSVSVGSNALLLDYSEYVANDYRVLYRLVSGTGVTGLTDGQIYWTVSANVGTGTVRFATTKGGTPLNISAAGVNIGKLYALDFFPNVSSGTTSPTLETSNPLKGVASLKFTQTASGSLDRFLDCPVNAIERIDSNAVLEFSVAYDASDTDFISGMKGYLCKLSGEVVTEIGDMRIDSGIGIARGLFQLDGSTTDYKVVLISTVQGSGGADVDLIIDEVKLKAASGVNIPLTQEVIISMTGSGGFTGGSIRVARAGSVVSISTIADLTHSSASSVSSAAGLIPIWARPTSVNAVNVYATVTTPASLMATVLPNGTLSSTYINSNSGASVNRTSTGASFGLSYTVESKNTIQGLAQNANLYNTTKYLASAITSTTSNVASLAFNDLVIGRKYFVELSIFSIASGVNFLSLTAVHNGNTVGVVENTGSGGGSNNSVRSSRTGPSFIATATTMTVNATVNSTGTIQGNGTNTTTYVTVKEIASPTMLMAVPDVELFLDTGNGFGSTANRIRRYTNVRKNSLSIFATYSDSAANGASITINLKGSYEISMGDFRTGASAGIGITVNSSSLTTDVSSLTYANGRRGYASNSGGATIPLTKTLTLNQGDIVRPQMFENTNYGTADTTFFSIKFLGWVT